MYRKKTGGKVRGRGSEFLIPEAWKLQWEGLGSWGGVHRKAWVGSSSMLGTAAQEKVS